MRSDYLCSAMRILVIGGGGREHALCWKLRQSPQVEKLWCAPGNDGIAQDAECIPVDTKDVGAMVEMAERLKPDLTVVGPEMPLVLGVADEFAKRGMAIVGPSKESAQLEGSKVFAKQFLERRGIPTGSVYGVYDSPGDAYAALCAVDWPVVIKADGLCAGKGVMVAPNPDEATAFIERLMEKHELGPGGERVLLEETLVGDELSYIVLTDGEHIFPLAPSRDHKRVFDGDQGPNTGGMGAYSADGMISGTLEETILATIVRPSIQGMAAEGRSYRGFLYFGLMLTSSGPKVLEFNCRLGDPETEALVVRMDFDLAGALSAAAFGNLASVNASWKPAASVCVVVTSGGYPGEFAAGKTISGLEEAASADGAVVFHAGTKKVGVNYYTSSGRVLTVAAAGASLDAASRAAYDAVGKIQFEGAHYRKDIGSSKSGRKQAAGD